MHQDHLQTLRTEFVKRGLSVASYDKIVLVFVNIVLPKWNLCKMSYFCKIHFVNRLKQSSQITNSSAKKAKLAIYNIELSFCPKASAPTCDGLQPKSKSS